MWELAKSVFKFGAGESNDSAADEDASFLSQSEQEHHTTMTKTGKQASSAKRRRELQENQARMRRKREERAYERAQLNSSRATRAAKKGKHTGLDNFDDSDDDEGEVRNVEKVARRHDFDSDEDSEGEEEFDDGQRGRQRRGRVSNSPVLNNADLISAVSERTVELERASAELERALKAAKDEIKSLKGELDGTRRRAEIMSQLKVSPHGAIDDPEYKRLDKDLKGIIRRQVLRIDKMWSDDMALYSDDKNTYCQIILNGIKWPGSISDDEKIRVWKEFLSPRFKRKFGLERNRINQAMRRFFNSELCMFGLCANCIILIAHF